MKNLPKNLLNILLFEFIDYKKFYRKKLYFLNDFLVQFSYIIYLMYDSTINKAYPEILQRLSRGTITFSISRKTQRVPWKYHCTPLCRGP